MLDDIAKSVVPTKFLGAEPVPLPHEEWEVANVLVGLEFEALEELVFHEVHFLVEFFVETVPVGFFALAETDAMLDADADEVDSGK